MRKGTVRAVLSGRIGGLLAWGVGPLLLWALANPSEVAWYWERVPTISRFAAQEPKLMYVATSFALSAAAFGVWLLWSRRATKKTINLRFNPDLRIGHATQLYSVGVINMTGVRQAKCSLHLDRIRPKELEKAIPLNARFLLPDGKTTVFDVPISSDAETPSVWIDVFAVEITRSQENWLTIAPNRIAIPEHIDSVEFTVRLDAPTTTTLLDLRFGKQTIIPGQITSHMIPDGR